MVNIIVVVCYHHIKALKLLQELALTCAACGSLKNNAKFKVWSCKFCTLENRVGVDKCLACGEWKYSYGPPLSNHGPYVGT